MMAQPLIIASVSENLSLSKFSLRIVLCAMAHKFPRDKFCAPIFSAPQLRWYDAF